MAIQTVVSLLKQIPTLVYCGAGMSRSPAVVAAALSIVQGGSPDEKLKEIVAGHPHDVSPHLWEAVCKGVPEQAEIMAIDKSKLHMSFGIRNERWAGHAPLDKREPWLADVSFPENGDAGFSSRNPNYTGPSDAKLEYFLNNGQGDEYPMAWALPIEEIHRALEFFEREKKPPHFITWHNDRQMAR